MKRQVCVLLAVLLLLGCVPMAAAAAEYAISYTALAIGDNTVQTEAAETTLYVFKPTDAGAFVVTADSPDARLSYWYGSKFFVTGLAKEADDGVLTVECSSAGQSVLIGLSGVDSAVITIAEQEGYMPPQMVVFEPYENAHTPVDDFALPAAELTRVDVTKPQTVVADGEGIYHWGSEDGPVLYVNMRAAVYADLYTAYHPTDGAAALFLHGVYYDEQGNKCGYEFLEAMRPYAEALDEDGYYYLTVDLADFIQIYGGNQGWFRKDSSPFTLIKQGKFIEESAWLVNAYYVAPATVAGDADGDGKVNNRDLGLLQRYLNGFAVIIDETAADISGDGKVNNRDLGLLQQLLNR